MTTEKGKAGHVGAVLHSALLYDVVLWFAFRGRERRFRRRLLELARLLPGERVLDVGCGTGSLAVLAKKMVGDCGSVSAIDASPEMIARARAKAARAGLQIRLLNATAQELPFADSAFDLALCTMMLHHLAPGARRRLAGELQRVVRPGGRVLLVDFSKPDARGRRMGGHLGGRHGHVAPAEMAQLLQDAGFHALESGRLGIGGLHFALGTARSSAPAEFLVQDLEQPRDHTRRQ